MSKTQSSGFVFRVTSLDPNDACRVCVLRGLRFQVKWKQRLVVFINWNFFSQLKAWNAAVFKKWIEQNFCSSSFLSSAQFDFIIHRRLCCPFRMFFFWLEVKIPSGETNLLGLWEFPFLAWIYLSVGKECGSDCGFFHTLCDPLSLLLQNVWYLSGNQSFLFLFFLFLSETRFPYIQSNFSSNKSRSETSGYCIQIFYFYGRRFYGKTHSFLSQK